MIDLSIIIVSWNTREFLLGCLHSIVETSNDCAYEITVVDNKSSDGSTEAVEKSFPEVRLIQTGANLGFAKANNIGILNTSGKYVCLMNSDVKVFPNCLERLRSYMDDHPKVGILGPKILNADLTIQRSHTRFPSIWRSLCRSLGVSKAFPNSMFFHGYDTPNVADDEASEVNVLYGSFWMVRREALREVGLIDESYFMYFEDVEWCIRFMKAGWKAVYLPAAQAVHYGGASSCRAPLKSSIDRQRSHLQYWRTHQNLAANVAIFAILLLHQSSRLCRWLLLYAIRPSVRPEARERIRHYGAVVWWYLTQGSISKRRY